MLQRHGVSDKGGGTSQTERERKEIVHLAKLLKNERFAFLSEELRIENEQANFVRWRRPLKGRSPIANCTRAIPACLRIV